MAKGVIVRPSKPGWINASRRCVVVCYNSLPALGRVSIGWELQ